MSRFSGNLKSLMMRVALGLLILYWWLTPAIGQISCFSYSGMLSCDSPSGNTLIAPLTPSQGVIQGDRGGQSYLEPYTILPPSRDSYTSGSRPYERESYSSRPIEPLRRLDRLDRLDDPFEDSLLAPFGLGE